MRHKKSKKIWSILFVCAIFLIAPAQNTASQLLDSLTFDTTPNYIQETGFYKIYKKKNANIVMLGNSLTHGVNWNELLNRDDVVERGIPGDVVEGYLKRLSSVTNLNPKVCFIMGGINDIYNWTPVEKIYQKYMQLIVELKKKNIIPVIELVIYAGTDYGKEWLKQNDPAAIPVEVNRGRNAEVEKLNDMLKNFAERNNIMVIDLNERMSTGKFLKKELTYDGLHLNPKGYQIWGEEVEKILMKLNLFD
jgi:lysophospholipase L1-like esterase